VVGRRALLGLVLVSALATNIGLSLACLELYRREQRVRLHPTFPVPAAAARQPQRTQALFLGDSRMHEWPSLPAERFVTVNAGGPGETTAQIVLRATGTLEAVQPELVVLQAGVNDLKAIGALPAQAREIEAQCLMNLRALVEMCRARGARVVLVPILPAARPSLLRLPVWSAEIDAARRRVNAALRELFERAPGVMLLSDQLLRADTPGDYRDTLHFTPQAYIKLEAAALKALEGP
jgi:lysophospholipase L1-like esterase